MIADKVSNSDAGTLAAVRSDDLINDEKLQPLAFLAAGHEERQIMEIALAVSVKTLSNYANHIFHTELDNVFIPYAVQNDGNETLQKID